MPTVALERHSRNASQQWCPRPWHAPPSATPPAAPRSPSSITADVIGRASKRRAIFQRTALNSLLSALRRAQTVQKCERMCVQRNLQVTAATMLADNNDQFSYTRLLPHNYYTHDINLALATPAFGMHAATATSCDAALQPAADKARESERSKSAPWPDSTNSHDGRIGEASMVNEEPHQRHSDSDTSTDSSPDPEGCLVKAPLRVRCEKLKSGDSNAIGGVQHDRRSVPDLAIIAACLVLVWTRWKRYPNRTSAGWWGLLFF